MAFDKAFSYLKECGLADRVIVPERATATVEDAAAALGCEPAHIAKTMAFLVDERPVLILCAGDGKVNSSLFKKAFHTKPKMIPTHHVEGLIGHAPGGVCPFGIAQDIPVYMDESLKRFEVVYPACGDDRSGVRLSVQELENVACTNGWVDVCKGWCEV